MVLDSAKEGALIVAVNPRGTLLDEVNGTLTKQVPLLFLSPN